MPFRLRIELFGHIWFKIFPDLSCDSFILRTWFTHFKYVHNEVFRTNSHLKRIYIRTYHCYNANIPIWYWNDSRPFWMFGFCIYIAWVIFNIGDKKYGGKKWMKRIILFVCIYLCFIYKNVFRNSYFFFCRK